MYKKMLKWHKVCKKTIQDFISISKEQKKVCPYFYLLVFGEGIARCLLLIAMLIMPKHILNLIENEAGKKDLIIYIFSYALIIAILMYVEKRISALRQIKGYYLPHKWMKDLAKKSIRLEYDEIEGTEFAKEYSNAENASFLLVSKSDELVRLFFSSVLELMTVLAILSSLNFFISVIFLACSAVSIYIDSKISKNKYILRQKAAIYLHERNYPVCILAGYFSGIKEIISYSGNSLILDKIETANEGLHYLQKEKNRKDCLYRAQQYAVKALELFLLYLFMVIKYSKTSVQAGELVLFITAANELKQILNVFVSATISVSEVSRYWDDFSLFMNKKEMNGGIYNEKNGNINTEKDFKIEFKDVSFKYCNDCPYAVRNVSFTIEAGEKVVIVGNNGAGKSTLVKLMIRLYSTNEGEILLNGVNIGDYNYEDYQKLIATVFQDYQLFDDSIESNIGLGKPINEKVESFLNKMGFSKERLKISAENISGGERQIVAYARAINKNTPIKIYDEVSSAIDSIRESEIYQKVCENNRESVIFISHRMGVCAHADKVIFLKDGMVAGIGTHKELLALNEEYANLYNLQAEGYK